MTERTHPRPRTVRARRKRRAPKKGRATDQHGVIDREPCIHEPETPTPAVYAAKPTRSASGHALSGSAPLCERFVLYGTWPALLLLPLFDGAAGAAAAGAGASPIGGGMMRGLFALDDCGKATKSRRSLCSLRVSAVVRTRCVVCS